MKNIQANEPWNTTEKNIKGPAGKSFYRQQQKKAFSNSRTQKILK